jgi:MFS superfamily sulfate permease-like transporter
VAELWIPGVVFAIVLWAISKFVANALMMPLAIGGAIAVFYAVLGISGTTIDEAITAGWLLEPFGGGLLIGGIDPGDVDWSIMSNEAGGLLTFLVIVAIQVLLNLTALSSAFGEEIDLDRELRMVGVANLAAGAGGSLIGYHYVSLSTLGRQLKGDSRIVGVVVALTCLFAMTVGANSLAYIPKFVLGGMVMFVGIGFLDDWLVQSARKLSHVDLDIIVAILVVVETVGFLEGVALGLVVTVIIFVITYSKISVIRHELSGVEVRSAVERPPAHARLLTAHGDSLLYLKLHGFVFFATTVGLLEELRVRLDDQITHLILDFEQVTGVDTTAQQLCHVAVRQPVAEIPAHGQQDHVRREPVAGERDRNRTATTDHSRTLGLTPDPSTQQCPDTNGATTPTSSGAERKKPRRPLIPRRAADRWAGSGQFTAGALIKARTSAFRTRTRASHCRFAVSQESRSPLPRVPATVGRRRTHLP